MVTRRQTMRYLCCLGRRQELRLLWGPAFSRMEQEEEGKESMVTGDREPVYVLGDWTKKEGHSTGPVKALRRGRQVSEPS